ncbi:MAG: tetratricopeptide repeat protein [Myxococcota bacterium]
MRPIEDTAVEQLTYQLELLHQAERERHDSEIPAARQAVGQLLWTILDGPEYRLTRAMDQAHRHGEPLDLVIRLRILDNATALAMHPAVAWRWALLCPPPSNFPTTEPPVANQRLRLVVQLGDVDPCRPPRALTHGGLRITFMAYSPHGATPLLDFEAEEERILRALERPIRNHRARVQVVEDGTLDELERRLRETPADIVHLSGHGTLTMHGPRLLMEDALGQTEPISPDQLLRVLQRAAKIPELVVISSCHSAEGRDGMPSFAASLVARGLPAVLGWVQPIRDDVATIAASDLYDRLCKGDTPAQAVAFVRQQLREFDRSTRPPSHAWGTIHLLVRDARGFRVDLEGSTPLPKTSPSSQAIYTYLGVTGGMRVLQRGFIGRRRPLQRLLRVLRYGSDDGGQPVAGAVVLGMKGVGKSCLVGRALERHLQDHDHTTIVVLHGVLDDVSVVERFVQAAAKRGDDRAEAILQRNEPVPRRLWRLLTTHWDEESIVIVLDDFEQNLALRSDGDARPTPSTVALLEVLLPACAGNQPKLLITTTASFERPTGQAHALVEVVLGPFEPPTLHKLWSRMPQEDQQKLSPTMWTALAHTLGRNARVLDWARTLLRGKAPPQVEALACEAGQAIPRWKDGQAPSDARVAELARLFLRTLAIEATHQKLSDDALTFVRRARVYEWPVTREGFDGLTEGLQLSLGTDITVLQNLGLLEAGELGGQRAHRVSPLIEPRFEIDDAPRWHGVAAAFWDQQAKAPPRNDEAFEWIMRAWSHALTGQCEEIATRCGPIIDAVISRRALHRKNRELATEHLSVFPESEVGLLWSGKAQQRAGAPQQGWAHYERAEALAIARGATGTELRWILWRGSEILERLGRYVEAEQRLQTIVAAECTAEPSERDTELLGRAFHSLAIVQQRAGKLTDAKNNLRTAIDLKLQTRRGREHPDVAVSWHALAGVLEAQGDLAGARTCLKRTLAIQTKTHGTDLHPDIAASLHELAAILEAQGDLAGARTRLERCLAIQTKVHGTDPHPNIAASLHELAGVLAAQGDLAGARDHLERSLAILTEVHGTDPHPSIATSLHELADVLAQQGELASARAHLERCLAILTEAHGTDPHPSVAASLHALGGVLAAQGEPTEARAHLERALAINTEVHGTDRHPSVAASLHELAGVLAAQGDLAEARTCIERSLAIHIEVHGIDEHPSVALGLHALAGIMQCQGRADEAIETYHRALAISARVFDSRRSHHQATTEFSLGMLLLELGRQDEAHEHLRHAHAVFSIQAPDHPTTAILHQLMSADS